MTPSKQFDKDRLAEVEINKFYYEGRAVDRIMIVLRASGCEHYGKTGGCSMCSHLMEQFKGERLQTKIISISGIR